ncbi:MAG: hypothetical protein H0U74_21215 [Bradymonadaceae bacterium]|nr:hypothetical protein [Lujinxingiaceae bacterium]
MPFFIRRSSVVLALLLVACSPSSRNKSDDASDVQDQRDVLVDDPDGLQLDDVGHLDSGQNAAGSDAATPDLRACLDRAVLDQTWTVAAKEIAGQLQTAMAFDGQGIWVVFTRPGPGEERQDLIYATRVQCDGTPSVAPFQVSQLGTGYAAQPVIAAREGKVHIAWAFQDTNTGHWDLLYRAFEADGRAYGSQPSSIAPSIDDTIVSELAWHPDIAALPDGAAVIVAAVAVDGNFQTMLQRVGADGQRSEDAFYPYANDIDQLYPSVSSHTDGTIYVAWTRDDNDAQTVVHTYISPGATEAALAMPLVAHPLEHPNPFSRMSKAGAGPNERAVLAFQVTKPARHDIMFKDATLGVASSHYGVVGHATQSDFLPSVAASPTGGAIAWYRYATSPAKSDVYVQRFTMDANGGLDTPSTALRLAEQQYAYNGYGPAIAHIGDELYAVAWSAGERPAEARVTMRIVNLAP